MGFKVQLGFAVVAAIFTVAYGNECLLPPATGTCPDGSAKAETRYYYSAHNLKCTEFPYSTCGGNANNFKSEQECNAKCSTKFSQTPDVVSIGSALKNSQCWFNKKTYSIGDRIPEATNDNACAQECFCSASPDGSGPTIKCAQEHCPPFPMDPPGCVPTVTEGRCCPEFVCPEQAAQKKNELMCTYKGLTYIENEPIQDELYPCIFCACNRNFNGTLTTEGGVCKEVKCGLTFRSQHQLLADCTPKYIPNPAGKDLCCPVDWQCPA